MGDQRGRLVSGNWYAVIALDHGSAPSVNVAVGLGGGDCGGR